MIVIRQPYLAAGRVEAAGGGLGGGLGVFVPGAYHSPENPVIQGFERMMLWEGEGGLCQGAQPGTGVGVEAGNGLGCGACGGRCGNGVSGVSGVAGITDTLGGWTPYILGGLGLLLVAGLFMRGGASQYKEELVKARREFQDKVQRIREKYPRYGRRIKRAVSAAGEAF